MNRMPRRFQNLTLAISVALALVANLQQTATAQDASGGVPANSQSGDGAGQKFMMVLNISENDAQTLRRDGILRANLPANFQNRIDSLLLKHPTTFLSKKLVVDNDVDKAGQTLIVNIDEAIVDRLEYQPVKIKVYQSGFTSIVLKYQRQPGLHQSLATNVQNLKASPADSPPVFVRLNPDNGTTGWIRKMKTLTVTTEFGEIKFPLDRIAGVRFNTTTPQDILIITTSGDYLSGKISLKSIVLATRWGDEKLAITDLESITHHHDSRFIERNDDSGKRWSLSLPEKRILSNPMSPRFLGNPLNY